MNKLYIKEGKWCFGKPKTENGIRTIFLTETALEILKDCKKNSNLRDDTPEEFRDLVFLGEKSGMPIKNSTYCEDLARVCKRAGVKKVSMHDLRHTFATRFVDSSSNYKVLSKMLGHSSIKITLDLYVHDDPKIKRGEVDKFSDYMKEEIGF